MNDLWSKAGEAAEEAHILFQAHRYDGATSRAYYAMFSAARALLAHQGDPASGAKRHTTVWRQFSLRFVACGPFEKSEGEFLARIGDLRKVADYSERRVSLAAANTILVAMDRFMNIAEREMAKPGRGSQA